MGRKRRKSAVVGGKMGVFSRGQERRRRVLAKTLTLWMAGSLSDVEHDQKKYESIRSSNPDTVVFSWPGEGSSLMSRGKCSPLIPVRDKWEDHPIRSPLPWIEPLLILLLLLQLLLLRQLLLVNI